ncbi:hypothetical protein [Gimesia fumaroli]|uniref:Uncharacterized protein n=1 Tax=Gimesia fumaroli TaxID=2527976 RepID=A0A518I9Q9_9PLAN|nr:hypothetical protein [Gimesia fumaroli]QDV49856.1 hypothetical protein Enr17x_18770 [Gimesia fumaroli]
MMQQPMPPIAFPSGPYRVKAEVMMGTGNRPVVTVLGPAETESGENV